MYNLVEALLAGTEQLSVVGLGYVGLPIAAAFSKKIKVVGFDASAEKIKGFKEGEDPTNEVGREEIKNSTIQFTCDENQLKKAKFHIVAVPTPINIDKTPNLGCIISATQMVGRNLANGSIVVYESTVYPGVTEECCIPLLEQMSGLRCGIDFKVGYSPERINPGDKEHRLHNIVKIVSAIDKEALNIMAEVYGLVVGADIYKAECIKVAEASKVIENCQRDINIAFMNELALLFHKMGINTNDVLDAANTKWNFLDFKPGLVGGHCIGVDPYYLTYRAEQIGFHPQVILAGRKTNDEMGKNIAEYLIKTMIREKISVSQAKVAILGLTFKENCPDTRNTKVMDIIRELKEYSIDCYIYDPLADSTEAEKEYGIRLRTKEEITGMDVVVVAVAHNEFKGYTKEKIENMFLLSSNRMILFDLKAIYQDISFKESKLLYWQL